MSTLEQLAGKPELTLTIGGQEYHFSELTLDAKARLHVWLRNHTPDPLESVKAGLEGLPPADRQYLLNEARKERLAWPPEISTANGRLALLGSENGQQELLFEGLLIHHPEMTRPGAFKIYRLMEREPNGADMIKRIYATLLHLILPDEEEAPPFSRDLKLQTKTPSTGTYSTDGANKN